MIKLWSLFILVINILPVKAQEVARDTSFTLQATYLKEKKKRPYIDIAVPTPAKNTRLKQDIVYKNVNGRVLLIDVYFPKRKRKQKPAVLMIFGGGWRSGDKTHNRAMGIELANNGFVAFSPEYRLSPEAKYPAAVYDVKAAIKWIKANAREYGVDTGRIAVMGCSAGGQLAALTGATMFNPMFEEADAENWHTSSVSAVINIDGIAAFHHPESEESGSAALWLGGKYQEKPDNWNNASALTHLSSSMPPILFLNSSNPRFHAGRDDMIKKLDSLKIYSEVHTFEDTPHPFWFFHPWFNPMMEKIIAFIHKQFD